MWWCLQSEAQTAISQDQAVGQPTLSALGLPAVGVREIAPPKVLAAQALPTGGPQSPCPLKGH